MLQTQDAAAVGDKEAARTVAGLCLFLSLSFSVSLAAPDPINCLHKTQMARQT